MKSNILKLSFGWFFLMPCTDYPVKDVEDEHSVTVPLTEKPAGINPAGFSLSRRVFHELCQ